MNNPYLYVPQYTYIEPIYLDGARYRYIEEHIDTNNPSYLEVTRLPRPLTATCPDCGQPAHAVSSGRTPDGVWFRKLKCNACSLYFTQAHPPGKPVEVTRTSRKRDPVPCPACGMAARTVSTGAMPDRTEGRYRKLKCRACETPFVQVTSPEGESEIRRFVVLSRNPDSVPRLAGTMSKPRDPTWGASD